MPLSIEQIMEMAPDANSAAAGKKLDMGGCCIRFKKLEDAAVQEVQIETARGFGYRLVDTTRSARA